MLGGKPSKQHGPNHTTYKDACKRVCTSACWHSSLHRPAV